MRDHRIDTRQLRSRFRVTGRPATGDDGPCSRGGIRHGHLSTVAPAAQNWKPRGLSNCLPALARSLDCNAARVDDAKVGALRKFHLSQAFGAKQRRDLLALILVDLAAQ